MSIQLISSAFLAGTEIPAKYTADGDDISPPLNWSEPPVATRSLALICDDPDAPRGTWVHWVLYNLPPETRTLPEGVSKTPVLESGAAQGQNDFGRFGYGGPAPPRGKPHRYCFRIFALDTSLKLGQDATKSDLERAMAGHVLAEGSLTAIYQR